MILKTLLTTMLGVAMTPSLFAFNFNYAAPGASPSQWGTEKKDTYDVAILVKGSALVGMKVTGLSVPIDAPDASDAKAWLTSELKLKKVSGVKSNDPDILVQDATIADGMLDVTFTEPYTLTADGVYVGYSFEMTASTDEADKKPVATYAPAVNDDGFYVHTRRAYIAWESLSAKFGCVSAMDVKIEGQLPQNDLEVVTIPYSYARQGDPLEVTAFVANHGQQPVNSFTYRYAVGDTKGTATYTFAEPLAAEFNVQVEANLTLPAIDERGVYDGEIAVTAVNGQALEGPAFAFPVRVMTFVPQKRVVMEEYTGGWCGWCPRGTACLAHMTDDFPETFIGLAYHSGDAMAVSVKKPYAPNGYPASCLDRGSDMSPAYLSVYPQFVAMANKLPVANIEVSATMDSEKVVATTTTTFLDDVDKANYRIAYCLVGNGLHGEGEDWTQSNYFSGKPEYLNDDPYLEEFVNGEEHMNGLRFNHVLVYSKDLNGIGGSVPEAITGDTPMEHSNTIMLSNVVNSAGVSLIQPEATYDVVALLINGSNGKIANAARCRIGGEVGIADTAIGNQETAAAYYDLMGRRIANPQNGIYVKVQDGKATKVAM